MRSFFKINFILFVIFTLLHSVSSYSQNREEYINELKNELEKTKDKYQKFEIKIKIEEVKLNMEIDSWIKLIEEAKRINYKEGEGKCLNNVGYILSNQGKTEDALKYYHKALNIYNEINSLQGQAGVYNDIAGIYSVINEKGKSIEFYQKANEIYIKTKDSLGISMTFHNLASHYTNIKDIPKAKKLAKNALYISTQLKDSGGLPSILQNLGSIYEIDSILDSAIIYYSLAYKISKKINLQEGIGFVGISLGEVHVKNYKKNNLNNKSLDSAEMYFSNSFHIGNKLQNPELVKRASQRLMRLYEIKKNWEKAFEYTKLYFKFRDTLENSKRQKEVLKSQLEYEHNIELIKKEEKIKEDKLITEQKSKQQKIIIITAIIFIIILLIFTIIIIRRWQFSKKQSLIIAKQKIIVEEKQKEILDSINYSKRLQDAILPPQELIDAHFSENFIYYQPKDIVAGDFYWAEKVNEYFFIAAADCTGHGVPGAMVSVVCSNALNRAIKEFRLTDPGEILDKTKELVTETFDKSNHEVKDGMDISLIAFNTLTKEIKWAGANNSLLYQNNKTIVELKATKQPIGKSESNILFESHSIHIEKGNMIYLITDGYADQFGGEKGKKFKLKNLIQQLEQNFSLTSSEQKNKLHHSFLKWQGNLEQVDDVCIIGIRV